jgi:hypothetical protein
MRQQQGNSDHEESTVSLTALAPVAVALVFIILGKRW